MPQRRANDAQVERLLRAMRSREYRQALARQVAKLPEPAADAKLPAKGTDKRRAYDSAMRRFERYVAPEGKQRRSFAAGRAEYRAPVVVAARRVPLPESYEAPAPKPKPAPVPSGPRPSFFEDIPRSELDYESTYQPPEFWETDLYDLRATLSYFDGDSQEASEALAAASGDGRRQTVDRQASMLDLAANGTDVFAMRGAGALSDAYREWYEQLPADDQDDITDFNALLHNLPDWQIEMIIADMQQGDSTFADWIDGWRDSGMDMDSDENDYWQLWREAYARAKK